MVIPVSEDTPIQKISADLILVVVWLAASIAAIYIPILNETPVRYVLTIPVVLFIPGYSLIAALFPRKDDISLIERIALSIGLSVVIIPFIGLGLHFAPGGIQLEPILVSLTLFTLIMVLITFFRRSFLPPEERFRMPFSGIWDAVRKGLFPPDTDRVSRLLSGILILVIIVAISTTIYVIIFPKESEHFSEFYLLGENRTAAEYPDQIISGLQYPMFIGVGNHEYRNMNYTIETWAMRTEFDNTTNISTILTMDPLDHTSLVLSHNETRSLPYNLSVKNTSYNRVGFLLFNESVPGPDVQGSDRINASYRDLHLLVTVGEGVD
jgi:uncharacterized membrane protein